MEQSFRTAFRGFNREDVVHYLEYLNNQHRDQVNQLRGEIAELALEQTQAPTQGAQDQAALEAQAKELTALRSQVAQLQSELTKAQEKCRELEARSEAAALSVYRRSEDAQRNAREQADLVYYQASGVLAEATARIESASGKVTVAADQAMTQLTQLQAAISSGKQSLQDATSILKTIKPNRS